MHNRILDLNEKQTQINAELLNWFLVMTAPIVYKATNDQMLYCSSWILHYQGLNIFQNILYQAILLLGKITHLYSK